MFGATVALVAVTFLLAVGAAWYATETRRMVKRMDMQREESVRPFLALQVVPFGPNLVKLRIQNLGPGPALNVTAKFDVLPSFHGSEVEWSYPLLAPGKYEEFGFPAPPGSRAEERHDLNIVRERISAVTANFAYGSASGRRYNREQCIDVSKVGHDWVSSGMMATEDHPERLMPRIAKALEGIGTKLERIKDKQ